MEKGIKNKKVTPNVAPVPKSEESAPEQITTSISAAVDARFKSIEGKVKSIDKIMSLLVLVLFIGFVSCFIGVAAIFVQFWQLNANMQSELTKSVKENTQTQQNFNDLVVKLNQLLKDKK